jgi:hypothetical protein
MTRWNYAATAASPNSWTAVKNSSFAGKETLGLNTIQPDIQAAQGTGRGRLRLA